MQSSLNSFFVFAACFCFFLAAPSAAAAGEADDAAEDAAVSGQETEKEQGSAEPLVESPDSSGGGAGVAGAGRPGTLGSVGGFELGLGGYLRSVFTVIDHDEAESDFIGRNDGFGMASVRFGVSGSRDRSEFEISLDGTVAVADTANTARGQVAVRVADAWGGYDIVPGALALQFGQQKPPFDAESLLSNAELPFIGRSVWNRGVVGVEGWNLEGLGVTREVGITLAGDTDVGLDPLAFSYYVAVTNGTPASELLNENQSLAGYARLEAHVGDFVTLGGAAYRNMRTYGDIPDLLDELHIGFAGDLVVQEGGAWLRLDFVQRQVDYPEVETELSRISRGFGASVGYRTLFGLEPAYRIAYLDPAASFPEASPDLAAQLEASEVLHHTVGLSWLPDDEPFAVQLNYTHSRENPARAVRNDRLELLGRLVF